MLNNNYNNYPNEKILSLPRIISIQLYYWIVFLIILPDVLPIILYQLGVSVKILPLAFQFTDYLISAILVSILSIPLLKKEKHLELGRFIQTLIVSISFMLSINVIFSIFMTLLDFPKISNNQQGLNDIIYLNKSLYLLMTVVFAPILEELIFRGGIFRTLRRKHNFLFAACVSAILFGFIHISHSFLTKDYLDLIYLFLYSGLGFVLAWCYEKNQSIYGCIILHIIYNFIGSSNILYS